MDQKKRNQSPTYDFKLVINLVMTVFLMVTVCMTCDPGTETVDDETQVSTEYDLAPTPEFPYRWHPFDDWPGDQGYPAYEKEDNLDLVAPLPEECPTHVHMFNLYTRGQIRGSLSFNQYKRGGSRIHPSMNRGNTTLGGFIDALLRPPYIPLIWLGYKYQVEIRFLGPLEYGFFGQMISSAQWFEFTDPEFKADSPENDSIGKVWHLAPGDRKSDFPVIEIVKLTDTDHIVRYIDAPGGFYYRVGDRTTYVLIYAGACGVVTHVKYLKIYYPDIWAISDSIRPVATELTPNEFKDAVGGWKFADN